jgi:hypothetical protein
MVLLPGVGMQALAVFRTMSILVVGVGGGYAMSRWYQAAPLRDPTGTRATANSGVSAEAARASNPVAAAYASAIMAASRCEPAEHVPSDDPHVDEPTPEDYVRRAHNEPFDEHWAGDVTPLAEADLNEASERIGFRYAALACRSTQCVAELDWPDLSAARQAFKTSLTNALPRTNCEQRLLLPDSAANGASVHSFLILRCNTPRALPSLEAGRAAAVVKPQVNREEHQR